MTFLTAILITLGVLVAAVVSDVELQRLQREHERP